MEYDVTIRVLADNPGDAVEFVAERGMHAAKVVEVRDPDVHGDEPVGDESGGFTCTAHNSPLFDTDTHPWRCEAVEAGEASLPCTFTRGIAPRDALKALADQLSEFDSFAEGFDHEFHGDEPDEDGDFPSQGMEDKAGAGFQCRFDQANTEGAFETLDALIRAAEKATTAEPDALFEGVLDELAAALKGEQ